MKFLLRHFYNISLGIGIISIICTIIFWHDMSFLQRLSLLNFAVINFHFFEEFGFPGGFPAYANTMFAYKNSPAPDRYPLNQLSALLINWGTAIVLYLPPILFPDVIWFGLAPILFGGIAQLLIHGIYNNILLKRFYNSGLAAVLFGHVPILIIYIYYITVNNLASGFDYLIGTAIMVSWYIIGVRIIITKSLEDMNSPYPFDEVEMKKFTGPKK